MHDGTFYDEDGEEMSFEADKAVYRYFSKRLDANDGARVSNEDMDLVSDRFSYDQETGNLVVSGGGGLPGHGRLVETLQGGVHHIPVAL